MLKKTRQILILFFYYNTFLSGLHYICRFVFTFLESLVRQNAGWTKFIPQGKIYTEPDLYDI